MHASSIPKQIRHAAVLLCACAIPACDKPVRATVGTQTPAAPAPASAESGQVLPGMAATVKNPSIQPILERVDAANDQGWQSEELSDAAQKELKKLLEATVVTASSSMQAKEFRTSRWRPKILEKVFSDSLTEVWRTKAAESTTVPSAEAAASLRESYAPDAKLAIKLKTFRVTPADKEGTFTTEVLLLVSGAGKEGAVQQNATWRCTWAGGESPVLRAIEVLNYEEILPVAKGLRYEDVTVSAFRNVPAFAAQLMRGIDYWRPRLQGDFGIDVNGLQGLALGDADGDGLDDIYVCQQGGIPNKLFLRNLDGTLRDVSAGAGVDWMEVTRAALFVDLDNDGDQDLALAQGWYFMLMENDGHGRFTKKQETRAEANLHSLAAADADLDGDLDLYFCGRNPAREMTKSEGILGQPMPYHDANNGGPNIYLRNDGGWKFKDATVETGLDVNNRRYSYACSWEDYDLDGDPDLYVANDFGRNNLYRNDGGKFTDVAGELKVEDISAGMGVTWGDANNDGRPDIYVSNMFSSAGNRIAYQRNFRAGEGANAEFQRHARGNTLFMNGADGFTDVSVPAGVTMARWAWGAHFVDLNNDGWEDLYVANGFITTEDTNDL
ncbi:MAG TPA: VCBS repeat-containing protein [Verrucomicrobiales bacterium]|nr:VCBS repeat-containing protein [Verrucomicrobiales bacterium]